MPLPLLQPFYYLDHFQEMVDFVLEHSVELLGPEHRGWLEDFGGMSQEARALYVRMLNRKGRVFDRAKLRYAEISNPESAWAELETAGFAVPVLDADFGAYLDGRTKSQLLMLLRLGGVDDRGWRQLAKEVVRAEVERVLDHATWSQGEEAVGVVTRGRSRELEYLFFLYFGRLSHGLRLFTLRDLGVMRTRRQEGAGFEPRFASREAALEAYFFAEIRRVLDQAVTPVERRILAEQAASWPVGTEEVAQQKRERLLHDLGRALERDGEAEMACEVLALARHHPATERHARLVYALQGAEAARPLLDRMLEEPDSDEELLFAEDFFGRKYQGMRVGALSTMLREARVLALDESGRDEAEAAAVRWFRQRGGEAWHVENAFWRMLFGLAFWDLLYGAQARLPNEFERWPPTLRDGSFGRVHAAQLAELAERWRQPGGLAAEVERTAARVWGEPNGLFFWDESLLPVLLQWLREENPLVVVKLLRRMAEDFQHQRDGYPDLLVRESGRWRWIEIKAEGDSLRRNQLRQLQGLQQAGLEVAVHRVQWMVDPDQEYAVVDVETTGGRADRDRLTEVAVVRVRGGEVTERWQSLIHPGRGIPSFITRLTGISNAMVAEAPTFSEVAGELRAFIGEAVLVAHNASFDYGFLRAEYGRLEQVFQRPVLCTKVESRRHFPGLKSYGLAALTEHFGIPLTQHHRALCDAEATAQLLLRINQRRRAAIAPGDA